MTHSTDAADALDIARAVADEAAALLRDAAGNIAHIRAKSNAHDIVTEWDTRSEALIRERLARLTPDIPLLAEESADADGVREQDGDRWLVDPIDGTVNFVHGLPIFSVAISLERAGQPIAGAVYAPVLGWQFYGHAGGGSFMNGERMTVSEVASLDRAMLVTGFPYDRATHPANNFAQWEHFQRHAQACRRLGSASLDLCMVARGWIDGYWERRLNPWDISAGALFVREAGGRASAPDGGRFVSARGEIIASNGHIHESMVTELAAVDGRARA